MRRATRGIARHLDPEVIRYHQSLELYLDTPELHTYTPALLHGDFSPGHFLADTKLRPSPA